MAQDEKKIIEKPFNQSLDLTPLYLVTGMSNSARKTKLSINPIQGSNIFELRAWVISVHGFAAGIHPSRKVPLKAGNDKKNNDNPIQTAHQSSFLYIDDQSIFWIPPPFGFEPMFGSPFALLLPSLFESISV